MTASTQQLVYKCNQRDWYITHTLVHNTLSKGCHLDVVRGPSTPHDPDSDAGGSLSSWQGHTSR
jgi:hypothetical protein